MTRFIFGARYPLPPEVAIRDQLELPTILAGDKLALHFEADPKVGVALTGIEHRGEDGSFIFRNGLPRDGIVVATTGEVQDRGLWAMRLTTQRGEQVGLAPRDAQQFAAYAATGLEGEPALLFVWGGMQVPGAPDYDQPGVMVLVSLAPDSEVSRWRAWVARARGASASIDSFTVPMLAVRGPMEPREGETHFDAQRRARFFLPSLLGPLTVLTSTNLPLWLWLLGLTQLQRAPHVARHSNPEQVFQFTTLYAASPAEPAGYRRMLYCGSEDRTGHYKEFLYGGSLVVAGSDVEAYWHWSATFVPSFQDPIADPASPPATEWGNTLVTPYPAVVGALRARTDAYWYDACAYYRTFVERSGIGGARVADRLDQGLAGTTDLFSATIQHVVSPWSGPALYDRILELHRLWLKVVENPFVSTATSFMHMQTYRQPDVFLGDVADEPLELSIGEGVREMLAEAVQLGVRASPYVYPGDLRVDASWTRYLAPEGMAYDRDGRLQGPAGVPVLAPNVEPRGPRVDYGAEVGQRFFPNIVIKALVEQVGFSGIYNDVFAGSGPWRSYDPPPPYAAQHPAHGGDYWVRGKARAIDLERAVLHGFGPGDEAERRRRSFVLSEAAEEFLAPHLDGFQDGYDWFPGHTMLAEEVIFGPWLSPPEIPLEAKDMSPPLWGVVYHEWAPSLRFAIALNNAALARNPGFFPAEGYPGLSGPELRDIVCFLYATNFVFGLGVNFHYHLDRDFPLIREEGGQLTVDREVDPEGNGLVIAAFLRTLFAAQEHAFAGRFCRLGRLERQLRIDGAARPEVTRTNPVEASVKAPPWVAQSAYPYFYLPVDAARGRVAGFDWGTLGFQVPRVLHNVWRSPRGEIGVLLVNWTAEDGVWLAEFDPALYGFRADEELWVRRLVQGERARSVASFAGKVAMGLAGARHGSLPLIDLGKLPAHSVGVFLVTTDTRDEFVLGRHIVVEGPDALWQSEAIDVGRDNAVLAAVTCLASDGFAVVPTLWGSNHPSQGFVLLVEGATEIGAPGSSATVQAVPIGTRYVQLRFKPSADVLGERIVVAATLKTWRA